MNEESGLEGKFIVMCAVSGGVTGTRQGPMKSDGGIMIFDEREAAEAAAQTARADRSPYGSAQFSYWVTPATEGHLQNKAPNQPLAKAIKPKAAGPSL